KAPIVKDNTVAKFHFFICLPTKKILAIISPKKKDQIKIGCSSIRYLAKRIKEAKLAKIPINKAKIKLPFKAFQKVLKPFCLRVFKREMFTLLMVEISSS